MVIVVIIVTVATKVIIVMIVLIVILSMKVIMVIIVTIRWTPHPVMVTTRDNRDYIRVLLYSYHTTITGWGVLLNYKEERCRETPM